MNDSIFRQGGPYDIKRTGPHTHAMIITIPADADGLHGRKCPSPDCSPAYFKVKMGTGITENQTVAYCPYCRHAAEPGDFISDAQRQYAQRIS